MIYLKSKRVPKKSGIGYFLMLQVTGTIFKASKLNKTDSRNSTYRVGFFGSLVSFF
jgi:hypothetical protein